MAIIPPQRKSISMVKAQLLNPATTSHFQVSVSFLSNEFNRYKRELGLNLDQGRLNILCSEASLPGSRFATAELTNNIPGVRGVGPKTAVKLIEQFDSLDKLIDNIDEIKNGIFADICTRIKD